MYYNPICKPCICLNPICKPHMYLKHIFKPYMYHNLICSMIGECRDEGLPDRLASSDLNPKLQTLYVL